MNALNQLAVMTLNIAITALIAPEVGFLEIAKTAKTALAAPI